MFQVSTAATERIRKLIDLYVSRDGNYLAQGPVWSQRLWGDLLLCVPGLPSRITREYIFSKVVTLDNFIDAEHVFLASMVWGYGNVGYGPYRVRRMVGSADLQLGGWVLDVRDEALKGDHCAYEFIMTHRLSHLGPSFASKLAYFLTPGGCSPILDSVVSAWVEQHEGVDLFNADYWSVSQLLIYQEYVQTLLDAVQHLLPVEHRTRGLIEHLMFVDQSLVNLPSWVKPV
jgi:hypothetical protein